MQELVRAAQEAKPQKTRPRERITLETGEGGMVHLEVWAGDDLQFRAMRKGGMRDGIRLAELFLDEGPQGFAPRPRGAEYMEIAAAITEIAPRDRFTSHRVTDLIFEENVHDRSLVLKNVSSALTKLRKRRVPYLVPSGKQGKSILYELSEVPTVAAVVADLQD